MNNHQRQPHHRHERDDGSGAPLDQAGRLMLSLEVPSEPLAMLAALVAERVLAGLQEQREPVSPWLDFDAARRYLGFSRDTLYKLTAARAIPFRKKQGGQRLLFHQGELDEWLERAYPRETDSH